MKNNLEGRLPNVLESFGAIPNSANVAMTQQQDILTLTSYFDPCYCVVVAICWVRGVAVYLQ